MLINQQITPSNPSVTRLKADVVFPRKKHVIAALFRIGQFLQRTEIAQL